MALIPGAAGSPAQMPSGIVGVIDGSNATTGNVGEAVRSYVASAGTLTTGSTSDIASITLQPGDWDISFAATGSGTITGTRWRVFIGTVAGNNLTGFTDGDNTAETPNVPLAGSNVCISMSNYRVNPTVATTYYLKTQGTFTAGSWAVGGRISARRASR